MVREVTFGALTGAIAWLAWGVLVVILAASGLWFAASGGATRFEIVLQTLRDWVIVFAPGAILGGAILGATFAKQSSSSNSLGLAAAATSVIVYSATFLAVFAWGRVRSRAAGYAAEQGMDALLIFIGPILGITAAPFWSGAFSWLKRFLVHRIIK